MNDRRIVGADLHPLHPDVGRERRLHEIRELRDTRPSAAPALRSADRSPTSGCPTTQPPAGNVGAAGRSASSPFAAPLSAHRTIVSMSCCERLRSLAIFMLAGPGAPRRHLAGHHLVLDRARPGPHVLVGDERHRRDLAGPMADDAVLVEDRRDVLRERRRLRPRRRGRADCREDDDDDRSECSSYVPHFTCLRNHISPMFMYGSPSMESARRMRKFEGEERKVLPLRWRFFPPALNADVSK